MPTYQYKCKCGRFEKLQSITDKPLKICPHCGGMNPERIISGGIGTIYKGSGFYNTDNRKKNG